MYKSINLLLVLLGASLSLRADTTNTIAILDLKSTTVEANLLVPLANRLSSEIINTGAYTVVERGEMEAILKEQGFQQNGCTDSSCAVQAGQLLNVHFIITGTVDKLGSIYSINVRMINVATSAIVRSISDDCVGCSIDDFVMKTVRRAALKLVGQDIADKSDEKVRDALAMQHFLYKGKRTGKLGSVTFDIKPVQSHVVFDDSGYGTGKILIENVPAKRHHYAVVPEQRRFMPGYGSVRIAQGEIAEVGIALRKAYFNIGASYCLAFFNGNFSIPTDTVNPLAVQYPDSLNIVHTDIIPKTKRIQNSGSVPATMVTSALGIETRWSYYTVVNHFTLGNVFGIPDRYNHDRDRAALNHNNLAFNSDTLYYGTNVTASYGAYFSYLRKVINLRDIFTACAGLSAGFGLTQTVIDFYKLQPPIGRALYNFNKDKISNKSSSYSQPGYGSSESEFAVTYNGSMDSYYQIRQLDFGGPVLMLTVGAPQDRMRFFVHYMLGIGTNTADIGSIETKKLTLANEFKAGWIFRL